MPGTLKSVLLLSDTNISCDIFSKSCVASPLVINLIDTNVYSASVGCSYSGGVKFFTIVIFYTNTNNIIKESFTTPTAVNVPAGNVLATNSIKVCFSFNFPIDDLMI